MFENAIESLKMRTHKVKIAHFTIFLFTNIACFTFNLESIKNIHTKGIVLS